MSLKQERDLVMDAILLFKMGIWL